MTWKYGLLGRSYIRFKPFQFSLFEGASFFVPSISYINNGGIRGFFYFRIYKWRYVKESGSWKNKWEDPC